MQKVAQEMQIIGQTQEEVIKAKKQNVLVKLKRLKRYGLQNENC